MNHGKKALSILTIIQLIFFSAVLIAALVIKLIGGPLYSSVQGWYSHAFHDSILADTTPVSSASSELTSGTPLPAPGTASTSLGSSGENAVSSSESTPEPTPDTATASTPVS